MIALQRRGKGHGAEREREKLEGEGGGGAEETYRGAPWQTALPEGQLPAGEERSDHKVGAAFPSREQRDLVIVRSDQQKTAKFAKNPLFLWHTRKFRGVVFSRISMAQG